MDLHHINGRPRGGIDHGSTRMRARLAAWLCMGFISTFAAADQQPGPVHLFPVDEQLDEVVVPGTSLWKLRQDMVKTEDQFFKLFNELNQNDDYDVHCRMQAPLGTRIQKRQCRIAFYEQAEAEAAQALLRNEVVVDPQLVMLQRQADYTSSALAVINGDQRLLRLVRLRQAIEKQYNAALKQRLRQGRWISF